MEWFENSFPSDMFADIGYEEGSREAKLLFLILSEGTTEKSLINGVLYNLQKRICSQKTILVKKAFAYGDGMVCLKSFEETEDEKIYYMDCTASPVSPSHLMIIADSYLRRTKGDDKYLLVIRESDYGINLKEEMVMKNVLSEKDHSYKILMVTNRIYRDWLEEYVSCSGGMIFLFSETDIVCDYIGS